MLFVFWHILSTHTFMYTHTHTYEPHRALGLVSGMITKKNLQDIVFILTHIEHTHMYVYIHTHIWTSACPRFSVGYDHQEESAGYCSYSHGSRADFRGVCVCCSVFVLCCSVLQCVVVCFSRILFVFWCITCRLLRCVCVLQCVSGVLQFVAVCCSVLQRVAVSCIASYSHGSRPDFRGVCGCCSALAVCCIVP